MIQVSNNRTVYYGNSDVNNDVYDANFRSKLTHWEDLIVGTYLTILCVLAVFLNTMVIYTCFKNWNSLVMSDIYILNLACSDVLLPLSSFPLAITSSFKHAWSFEDIGCTVYGLSGFFFGLVSISTLTMMGITRYISICQPHLDVNKRWITRNIIIGTYLFALIWSLIPLSGWGSYTVEAYGTSCTLQWTQNRSFITLMSVCCIVTPSVIMVLSYGLILLKCRRSNRNISTWQNNRNGKLSRKESYLIKITFAMCWAFLICWMPYAIVSMWSAYGDPRILPIRMTVVAVLLAKSSIVVNPIIYFLLSKKFRPMLSESFGMFGCITTCSTNALDIIICKKSKSNARNSRDESRATSSNSASVNFESLTLIKVTTTEKKLGDVFL